MWLEYFYVPITPTVSRKELLSQYGEIDLSNIKARSVTLNAANDMQEQEDGEIYTWLMASLTPEYRNINNLQKSDFINGN